MKLKNVAKKAKCNVLIKLGNEVKDLNTYDWQHKPVADYEVIDFSIELEDYPSLLLTVES